jgi:hypothetical protein
MIDLTELQALILLELIEDKIFMEKDIIRVEELKIPDYYIEQLELMQSMFKKDLTART